MASPRFLKNNPMHSTFFGIIYPVNGMIIPVLDWQVRVIAGTTEQGPSARRLLIGMGPNADRRPSRAQPAASCSAGVSLSRDRKSVIILANYRRPLTLLAVRRSILTGAMCGPFNEE
jgi:hypothetical protein